MGWEDEMNYLLTNVLAALCLFILFGFVWVFSYLAGHGYTLGTKRAERKASKEEESTP